MKNGRADHDDDDEPADPKIARIEDARRRKQLGLGGTNQRDTRSTPQRPRVSIGQWLFGALAILLAVGMLAFWTKPLWQGSLSFAP